MINFISVEDSEEFSKQTNKVIRKAMSTSGVEYKIYNFKEYDDHFKQFAKKSKGINVYLFDIKTIKGSGIDACRYIREQIEDRNSTIIIISGFEEYRATIMFNRLDIFDYVCKMNDMEKNLTEDIKVIIKKYAKNFNIINFDFQGVTYFVSLDEIVNIEKEKDSKKCLIRTFDKKELCIYGALSEIEKKLDKRFLRVHNSLIVNRENIKYYIKNTNELVFKNDDTTSLISRDKKKELFEYVGNSN
ncbi:MAG: LytTR family transcriptional regulator DNA-binding domain-containing protein [Bacilli bacterium]